MSTADDVARARSPRARQTGGYRFVDAHDGPNKGVWTGAERGAEASRRGSRQASAKAAAETDLQSRINAIVQDSSLSSAQKIAQLGLLRTSGYSDAEPRMIEQAKAAL